jgi:hypothetical protein
MIYAPVAKPHTHLSIFPFGWQEPGAQPMASQSRQYWRASPHPSSHEPNTSPSLQLMDVTVIVGRRESMSQVNYRMQQDRVRHRSSTRPIQEESREPFPNTPSTDPALHPRLHTSGSDVLMSGPQRSRHPLGHLMHFPPNSPCPCLRARLTQHIFINKKERTTCALRPIEATLMVICGTTLSWGQGRIPTRI